MVTIMKKMCIFTSSTPLRARNSIVYSNIGMFTRGRRTLGFSSVKGRKFFSKLSARRIAWIFEENYGESTAYGSQLKSLMIIRVIE
jgi:hypothetical protein